MPYFRVEVGADFVAFVTVGRTAAAAGFVEFEEAFEVRFVIVSGLHY